MDTPDTTPRPEPLAGTLPRVRVTLTEEHLVRAAAAEDGVKPAVEQRLLMRAGRVVREADRAAWLRQVRAEQESDAH